jgi:apolipoprotein N-acyltransferase
MSKLGLVCIALGIGVAAVALTRLTSGRPFAVSQLDLMQLMMVSIPFLVLALGGIRTRLPWLIGLALTLALWVFVSFANVGRAPTGAGLSLLLLASPLIIAIACIAAYAIEQRRRD